MPVDLLEIVDEGRFRLLCHCANCQHLWVQEADDAELEELDRELDRLQGDLQLAAELAEQTRMWEEAEIFAAALRDDLILPEDF